jgi:SAM-dependent methyltransferase
VLRDYQHGLRRGVANLWGLNVNLDQFLGDTMAGDYADLGTTVADLSALSPPPLIMTSPLRERPREDTFGPLEPCLRGLGTQPTVIQLPSDLRLYTAALDERHLAAFGAVLKRITAQEGIEHLPPDEREPASRDIHRQRQLEDERVRIRHHVSQSTRDALWVARLAQLPHLETLHEYWTLLEELYRWVLPLEAGMTIADLGCGQSDLARVIQTNLLYRSAHRGGPPGQALQYIGIEQTPEAVETAERTFHAFIRDLVGAFPAGVPAPPLLVPEWRLSSWDDPLPLTTASADRIMGNLFLSFVPSPLVAIRHALRTMKQDGILAVTCFQPHTDLSILYRRHLRTRGLEEFGPSVQIVLHYLGRLREALRHGLLHSFDRDRLTQLLIHTGAKPLHVLPLLDGQILLGVAENGKSAG